jgi:hypothetical protein
MALGTYARYGIPEEPAMLKFRLYEIEAGIDVENENEKTTFKDSDTESTYKRTFIAPTLSMAGSGSIYHPSFLRFSLAGEGAYGEGHEELKSSTSSTSRDKLQHFERLRGRVDLFGNKPLRGGAHGNYGRNYRDYDFFTRSTVESLGYGAQALYTVPSFYTTATYAYTDDRVLDSLSPSETEQEVVTLDARQERRRGASAIAYTASDNHYHGSSSDSLNRSTDQTVSASDLERFGARERFTLNNNASYSHRDSDEQPNDQYRLASDLEAEHRANLISTYQANYDRFEDPTLTSDSLSGGVGLHHQLYQSLHSSLTGRAGESRFETDTESDRSSNMGAGLAEHYTKQLGERHDLQADASTYVESVDQATPGRAVNERHTFPRPPDLEVVTLDLPNVDEGSLDVRDAANIRTFARGIDYEVFPRGSRTELRRISGGSIPEGSTIIVSYNADGRGSGRYQSRTDAFGIRFNLWDNFWALYGRINTSRNDAPNGLYVLDSTRSIAGTDLNFRQASLGAEREWYDSDDTRYESTRLMQSMWINPDVYSSASISSSQTFTDREDDEEQERDYRVTARYRRSLTRRLWGSVQAGFDRRRGAGVDQDLAVVRPELNYRIGRTSLDAYYDYERNLYLDNEERTRERLFASLKRTF